MIYAAGYAAILTAGAGAMCWLQRSSWTWRAPRAGIVAWQALGLAFGLALIGLPVAVGLAPYQAPPGSAVGQLARDLPGAVWAGGELPAGLGPLHLVAVAAGLVVAARLVWVTGACLVQTWLARRRHRRVLVLVGRPDPVAPGALVLDHPAAAAYCLPGLRPTSVVSAGALGLLRGDELAAVLCHERSHATERHDLVLLPFTALLRAVPPAGRLPRAGWLLRAGWLPLARRLRAAGRAASEAVALLVEMRADDRARRQYPDGLAAALRRFAAAGPAAVPAGALAAADRAVAIRAGRLCDRRRPPLLRGAAALAMALGLAVAPVGLAVVGG